MSALIKHDIKIDRGVQFGVGFTWVRNDDPVDLTNWDAKLQVRLLPTSSLLFEGTVGNETITLDSDGNINIFIPYTETETFSWDQAGWTLHIWDKGAPETITKFAEGRVNVSHGYVRLNG